MSVDSVTSAQVADPVISLQVGECHFFTLKSTLVEKSSFFRALLADEWQGSRMPNGLYFVDADPHLFVDILRYLRRGVFPLFYKASTGFDVGLYQALQAEASYFGIEDLHTWIKDQMYTRVVRFQYTVDEVIGDVSAMNVNQFVDGTIDRTYHPALGTEKVYQCPRNILVHMGKPDACGRACISAQGDNEDKYIDREVLRTIVVTKKTHIYEASLEK